MSERLRTFAEFWPYYLGQHQQPLCRALHYAGSTFSLAAVVGALVLLNPSLLLAALLGGYGPAWVGHFFVEHNRPATFTYPRWSLVADYKMYFLFLSGRLGAELEQQRKQGFSHKAAALA